MKVPVHEGDALGAGVGDVNGCVVHGTMISRGGGSDAPAVGGSCWMSTRIASGSVSAFVELPLLPLVVAELDPLVEALSAVLKAQLVCQFAPS